MFHINQTNIKVDIVTILTHLGQVMLNLSGHDIILVEVKITMARINLIRIKGFVDVQKEGNLLSNVFRLQLLTDHLFKEK